MHLLGNGSYTFTEVAQLTRLSTPRIREWFTRKSARAGGRPLFEPDYDRFGGHQALSFLDMVDVFVAGQLRERGVSLLTVRRVHATLQEMFSEKHAFCREELLTDGRRIFLSSVDGEGREHLIDILDRQHVFPKVIRPFLQALDYENRLAARWRIAEGIVVDPVIALGKPLIARAAVTTRALALAYHANNEDAETVGAWFDVSPDDVVAAVRFERDLAG